MMIHEYCHPPYIDYPRCQETFYDTREYVLPLIVILGLFYVHVLGKSMILVVQINFNGLPKHPDTQILLFTISSSLCYFGSVINLGSIFYGSPIHEFTDISSSVGRSFVFLLVVQAIQNSYKILKRAQKRRINTSRQIWVARQVEFIGFTLVMIPIAVTFWIGSSNQILRNGDICVDGLMGPTGICGPGLYCKTEQSLMDGDDYCRPGTGIDDEKLRLKHFTDIYFLLNVKVICTRCQNIVILTMSLIPILYLQYLQFIKEKSTIRMLKFYAIIWYFGIYCSTVNLIHDIIVSSLPGGLEKYSKTDDLYFFLNYFNHLIFLRGVSVVVERSKKIFMSEDLARPIPKLLLFGWYVNFSIQLFANYLLLMLLPMEMMDIFTIVWSIFVAVLYGGAYCITAPNDKNVLEDWFVAGRIDFIHRMEMAKTSTKFIGRLVVIIGYYFEWAIRLLSNSVLLLLPVFSNEIPYPIPIQQILHGSSDQSRGLDNGILHIYFKHWFGILFIGIITVYTLNMIFTITFRLRRTRSRPSMANDVVTFLISVQRNISFLLYVPFSSVSIEILLYILQCATEQTTNSWIKETIALECDGGTAHRLWIIITSVSITFCIIIMALEFSRSRSIHRRPGLIVNPRGAVLWTLFRVGYIPFSPKILFGWHREFFAWLVSIFIFIMEYRYPQIIGLQKENAIQLCTLLTVALIHTTACLSILIPENWIPFILLILFIIPVNLEAYRQGMKRFKLGDNCTQLASRVLNIIDADLFSKDVILPKRDLGALFHSKKFRNYLCHTLTGVPLDVVESIKTSEFILIVKKDLAKINVEDALQGLTYLGDALTNICGHTALVQHSIIIQLLLPLLKRSKLRLKVLEVMLKMGRNPKLLPKLRKRCFYSVLYHWANVDNQLFHSLAGALLSLTKGGEQIILYGNPGIGKIGRYLDNDIVRIQIPRSNVWLVPLETRVETNTVELKKQIINTQTRINEDNHGVIRGSMMNRLGSIRISAMFGSKRRLGSELRMEKFDFRLSHAGPGAPPFKNMYKHNSMNDQTNQMSMRSLLSKNTIGHNTDDQPTFKKLLSTDYDPRASFCPPLPLKPPDNDGKNLNTVRDNESHGSLPNKGPCLLITSPPLNEGEPVVITNNGPNLFVTPPPGKESVELDLVTSMHVPTFKPGKEEEMQSNPRLTTMCMCPIEPQGGQINIFGILEEESQISADPSQFDFIHDENNNNTKKNEKEVSEESDTDRCLGPSNSKKKSTVFVEVTFFFVEYLIECFICILTLLCCFCRFCGSKKRRRSSQGESEENPSDLPQTGQYTTGRFSNFSNRFSLAQGEFQNDRIRGSALSDHGKMSIFSDHRGSIFSEFGKKASVLGTFTKRTSIFGKKGSILHDLRKGSLFGDSFRSSILGPRISRIASENINETDLSPQHDKNVPICYGPDTIDEEDEEEELWTCIFDEDDPIDGVLAFPPHNSFPSHLLRGQLEYIPGLVIPTEEDVFYEDFVRYVPREEYGPIKKTWIPEKLAKTLNLSGSRGSLSNIGLEKQSSVRTKNPKQKTDSYRGELDEEIQISKKSSGIKLSKGKTMGDLDTKKEPTEIKFSRKTEPNATELIQILKEEEKPPVHNFFKRMSTRINTINPESRGARMSVNRLSVMALPTILRLEDSRRSINKMLGGDDMNESDRESYDSDDPLKKYKKDQQRQIFVRCGKASQQLGSIVRKEEVPSSNNHSDHNMVLTLETETTTLKLPSEEGSVKSSSSSDSEVDEKQLQHLEDETNKVIRRLSMSEGGKNVAVKKFLQTCTAQNIVPNDSSTSNFKKIFRRAQTASFKSTAAKTNRRASEGVLANNNFFRRFLGRSQVEPSSISLTSADSKLIFEPGIVIPSSRESIAEDDKKQIPLQVIPSSRESIAEDDKKQIPFVGTEGHVSAFNSSRQSKLSTEEYDTDINETNEPKSISHVTEKTENVEVESVSNISFVDEKKDIKPKQITGRISISSTSTTNRKKFGKSKTMKIERKNSLEHEKQDYVFTILPSKFMNRKTMPSVSLLPDDVIPEENQSTTDSPVRENPDDDLGIVRSMSDYQDKRISVVVTDIIENPIISNLTCQNILSSVSSVKIKSEGPGVRIESDNESEISEFSDGDDETGKVIRLYVLCEYYDVENHPSIKQLLRDKLNAFFLGQIERYRSRDELEERRERPYVAKQTFVITHGSQRSISNLARRAQKSQRKRSFFAKGAASGNLTTFFSKHAYATGFVGMIPKMPAIFKPSVNIKPSFRFNFMGTASSLAEDINQAVTHCSKPYGNIEKNAKQDEEMIEKIKSSIQTGEAQPTTKTEDASSESSEEEDGEVDLPDQKDRAKKITVRRKRSSR